MASENLTTSAMRRLSREERKTEIENSFGLMDKDGSNSVSVDEIVWVENLFDSYAMNKAIWAEKFFREFMLLKGKFDLGTKNQRDFSASVVRNQ